MKIANDSEAVAQSHGGYLNLTEYRNLLHEDGEYVFDANRVIARWIGGDGGAGWRLHTVDPDLSLVVTPDLRVSICYRVGTTCQVRPLRAFDSVFDTLKPLDDAIQSCVDYRHVWSATQSHALGEMPFSWQWCHRCGAERVMFVGCELETWVKDTAEINMKAAGALPTLHGILKKPWRL